MNICWKSVIVAETDMTGKRCSYSACLWQWMIKYIRP